MRILKGFLVVIVLTISLIGLYLKFDEYRSANGVSREIFDCELDQGFTVFTFKYNNSDHSYVYFRSQLDGNNYYRESTNPKAIGAYRELVANYVILGNCSLRK